MADFRLGRLKFNWRGDWVASTAYVIDDIVKFGANTYVCTTNHTSVSDETTWYATDLSKWSLHTEGLVRLVFGCTIPSILVLESSEILS